MNAERDTPPGNTADESIDYKKIHDDSIQGDGSGDPNTDRGFLQDLPPAQVDEEAVDDHASGDADSSDTAGA